MQAKDFTKLENHGFFLKLIKNYFKFFLVNGEN